MGVWRDLTAKQHAHTMADTQVEGRGVTAAWFSRSQQSPINKKFNTTCSVPHAMATTGAAAGTAATAAEKTPSSCNIA